MKNDNKFSVVFQVDDFQSKEWQEMSDKIILDCANPLKNSGAPYRAVGLSLGNLFEYKDYSNYLNDFIQDASSGEIDLEEMEPLSFLEWRAHETGREEQPIAEEMRSETLS